jgi:hypothetical protein
MFKKIQNFRKISKFSKKIKSGISKPSRAPQAVSEMSEVSGSRRSPSPSQELEVRSSSDDDDDDDNVDKNDDDD